MQLKFVENMNPWNNNFYVNFKQTHEASKFVMHVKLHYNFFGWHLLISVATPFWGKCEVATHTPENGTWESFGTPKNSECNRRGQNTSPLGVFYTIEKVLKCRCLKWPCISHLDICSTSYGQNKGHNFQP
jgi:hypothetical protein